MEYDNGKAKYYVLMEQLNEEIFSGKLQAGRKLPSENELVRRYGISRHTVRKVLSIL